MEFFSSIDSQRLDRTTAQSKAVKLEIGQLVWVMVKVLRMIKYTVDVKLMLAWKRF